MRLPTGPCPSRVARSAASTRRRWARSQSPPVSAEIMIWAHLRRRISGRTRTNSTAGWPSSSACSSALIGR